MNLFGQGVAYVASARAGAWLKAGGQVGGLSHNSAEAASPVKGSFEPARVVKPN